MAQPADLLRLLEPAVRPVAQPPRPAPIAAAPFESQTFENLLSEARFSLDPADPAPGDEPAAERPPDPLAVLADLSRVENPGLREMLAARA